MRAVLIMSSELDEFVAESDALGGPGNPACEDYWKRVEFQLDTVVDETLNPVREPYVQQQLAVYRELSGRELDQLVNEHTTIDVDRHAAAINPYDHGSPGGLMGHVERLSRALRMAGPPRGGKVLDMGCGWGLSAEVMAYAGLSVTAVDVNQDFVDLVDRRAQRLGHDITAVHSTFEDFETDERFDLILFYECLHHALRPWHVLKRMADLLAPGGRVVLAGEPINDTWWRHWGLRLDPMSVYCIRKFGWLENGWSRPFIVRAFRKAGLDAQVTMDPDPEVGSTVIGTLRTISTVTAAEVARRWTHDGWFDDGDFLVASATCDLALDFPENADKVQLWIHNFRGAGDLALKVEVEGTVVARHVARPGRSALVLDRRAVTGSLRFRSETWSPQVEHGSDDARWIGFHLADVTFL